MISLKKHTPNPAVKLYDRCGASKRIISSRCIAFCHIILVDAESANFSILSYGVFLWNEWMYSIIQTETCLRLCFSLHAQLLFFAFLCPICQESDPWTFQTACSSLARQFSPFKPSKVWETGDTLHGNNNECNMVHSADTFNNEWELSLLLYGYYVASE